MSRRRALRVLLCAGALAACGGDEDRGGPDAGPGELAAAIAALPHVISVDERTTTHDGYRYFSVGFEQPVDHDDPEGQRFTQFLTLIHIDPGAPMVLGTTGYSNYYGDYPMEPTFVLSANQIIIEHRYFGPSRPDPIDWSLLRVAQGVADHHEVVESFRGLYDGPWISAGGSKGGMTTIYHRHRHPDDVEGTVAYVAPHNRAPGDTRYDAWFDEVLPAGCLDRVRAAQVDFLANRRSALVERATIESLDLGIEYNRISIAAAVEGAVAGIEWAFFQYVGVAGCDQVPGPEADDGEAFGWLVEVNSPDSMSDDQIALYEPYYYQAYAELGYPSTEDPHLEGLLEFGPDDYLGSDPPEIPEYDPSEVDSAADWVRDEGQELIFLYGEFDPWTAGAFDLGSNPGATRFTVPEGTHQSGLLDLPRDERVAALALLEEWAGAAPMAALAPLFRFARPREPRVPVHALSVARRARAAR